MPQVTVYIRKEDLEKWEAVEKKAEFIHLSLNQKPINSLVERAVDLGVAIEKHTSKKVVKKHAEALCEHFQVKGYCLQKGCKFA